MAYVVSLENYRPGQRYDVPTPLPWTGARIDYSTTEGGSYTTVESFTFSDPDDDPTNPKARNFTTALSPVASGWFKVVFTRGTELQVSPAVYFPSPGIRPSIAEVASLLRARTRGGSSTMTEVGTFDATTRPTGDQVERLIDQAVADVEMRVGEDVPEELNASARGVVTLRTAMEIERSYQPEQSTDNFSSFQSLRLSYEEALKTLVHAVQLRMVFSEPEEEAA